MRKSCLSLKQNPYYAKRYHQKIPYHQICVCACLIISGKEGMWVKSFLHPGANDEK